MQKLNCKPGDLAIVVNALLPQNIGQIVEVLGPGINKPFKLAVIGYVWNVRTVSGRDSLFYRYDISGRIVQCAEGPVPDNFLRPVSGLADGDAVQEDVAVSVPGRKRKPRTVVKAVDHVAGSGGVTRLWSGTA